MFYSLVNQPRDSFYPSTPSQQVISKLVWNYFLTCKLYIQSIIDAFSLSDNTSSSSPRTSSAEIVKYTKVIRVVSIDERHSGRILSIRDKYFVCLFLTSCICDVEIFSWSIWLSSFCDISDILIWPNYEFGGYSYDLVT